MTTLETIEYYEDLIRTQLRQLNKITAIKNYSQNEWAVRKVTSLNNSIAMDRDHVRLLKKRYNATNKDRKIIDRRTR